MCLRREVCGGGGELCGVWVALFGVRESAGVQSV